MTDPVTPAAADSAQGRESMTGPATSTAQSRSLEAPTPARHPLAIYATPKMLRLLLLGFSSGLPLALVASTLSAWLTDAHVDRATTGYFAWVMVPYTLKILWAPLLDRYTLPLGRRRGWAISAQIGTAASLLALSTVTPATDLLLFAALATLTAVFSATQDVALDAYRTEVLSPTERGAGASTFTTGYRLGMLAASSVALLVQARFGWQAAYQTMAALMVVGTVTTLLSPEPAEHRVPRSLREAVVQPLTTFFARFGSQTAVLILVFLALYKLGDAFAGEMTTRMFKEMGYTNEQLGRWRSSVGIGATIFGQLVAGGLLMRMSSKRALVVFGGLQAVTNLLFVVCATMPASVPLLAVTAFADNFAGGLGSAAALTYIMGLIDTRYSATQFALLSAASTLAARTLSGFSGVLVDRLGWSTFFLATCVAALPALILIRFLPTPPLPSTDDSDKSPA